MIGLIETGSDRLQLGKDLIEIDVRINDGRCGGFAFNPAVFAAGFAGSSFAQDGQNWNGWCGGHSGGGGISASQSG